MGLFCALSVLIFFFADYIINSEIHPFIHSFTHSSLHSFIH